MLYYNVITVILHLLTVRDFLGLLTPLSTDYVTRPFFKEKREKAVWQRETKGQGETDFQIGVRILKSLHISLGISPAKFSCSKLWNYKRLHILSTLMKDFKEPLATVGDYYYYFGYTSKTKSYKTNSLLINESQIYDTPKSYIVQL